MQNKAERKEESKKIRKRKKLKEKKTERNVTISYIQDKKDIYKNGKGKKGYQFFTLTVNFALFCSSHLPLEFL